MSCNGVIALKTLMLRNCLDLSIRVTLVAMFVMIALIGLARLGGAAIAIRYGQFAPAQDSIFFIYLDVNRNLYTKQSRPLDVTVVNALDNSPDGRQTVQAGQNGGNVDLFLIEPNGRRQITHTYDFSTSANEREARRANLFIGWSPDGAWMAFISSDVNNNLSLYAVHPDGSDLHRLDERIRVQAALLPRWVNIP